MRFIAINDGIDTALGDNEIMPFKSVINEFYARDASKKVRSAFRTKALNGEHYASKPPYGYLQNPIDKHKLIIDSEAAKVVQLIFDMAGDGLSARNIATRLFKANIMSPAALHYLRTGNIHARYDTSQTCRWSEMTIKRILSNQLYLGHMVNHRQATKSFKSKSKIDIPESDWIIVKNTHHPIVDENTFEKAQKLISVKRRENKSCVENIFSGIVFCADCGKRLNYMSGGKHHGGKGGYECGSYRRCSISGMEKKCTPHHIGFVPIYDAVLQHVQKTVACSVNAEKVISLLNEREIPENTDQLKDLEKQKRRLKELKLLMKTTLEQSAAGILSSGLVSELLAEYQNEYDAVAAAIEHAEKGLSMMSDRDADVQQFIENIGRYTVINKLTREIVLDFIDKLVIYEPVKTGNERSYKIDIHYRFIGKFPEPVDISL